MRNIQAKQPTPEKASAAPLPEQRLADLINKVVEVFAQVEEEKEWTKRISYGQRLKT